MNDIQFYSVIMFVAGVLITKSVFYFEEKQKTKRFYLVMSAGILQVLDAVHSAHLASIAFAKTALDESKRLVETDSKQYLDNESDKIPVFMELYTLLLIRAVPKNGRKYINYRNWTEASALIEHLRGLTNEREDKS